MNNYKEPKVIAEIGCNHKGEVSIAKELIKIAKDCGADVAKFQKRTNKELLSEEQYNAPHPNMHNSYGNTYGEHREFLEFSVETHKELKEYCESLDIEYSTSVWDVTSAKEIASLKPNFIKIPSACNNNYPMMQVLRDEYEGDIHISVGMTTSSEVEAFIQFFKEKDQAKRLVVYSCTSGYPVPFNDVCLLEINKLIEKYKADVKAIGFSALKGTFQEQVVSKYTSNKNYSITDAYCFGGYAKVDSSLIEFINSFKQTYSIGLDPVYTGKLLYGVFDLIKKDYFNKNSRILALHTGGMQGVSGMNLKLKKKNLPLINV